MVLSLPDSAEELLAGFKAKLRSQVKKPLKDGLTGEIVGRDGLADFYRVFTENMRDLGSPVHSRRWFESILNAYGDNARIGLVKTPEDELAAAGIILLHKTTISIPWASSLRRYNRQNPNMLLYWSFLAFAADHGFKSFDFGRSTPGEGARRWGERVLSRWLGRRPREAAREFRERGCPGCPYCSAVGDGECVVLRESLRRVSGRG
jgi:lipid II:glycine glycyltransferase (peptidoglycan interpeptide bridge formation enzyme)